MVCCSGLCVVLAWFVVEVKRIVVRSVVVAQFFVAVVVQFDDVVCCFTVSLEQGCLKQTVCSLDKY